MNENYRDNPECYFDRLRAFGFYDVVNRQIDGEPVPQMIDPGNEAWTSTTLPSLSYGYSVRVTPLQMAAFYNGIANGGKMVRPYFVKEIRNNSQVVQAFQPEVLHEQMCSRETASKLAELLKSVVNYGSAASAFRGARFEVAGKTGTARKIEQGVGYVQKYRASFGGFFPADNPRYTLYIMVDEPAGGLTSGGTVAAPIFRNIADKVYLMDRQITKPQDAEKPGVQPSPRVARTQNAKIVFNELGIPASGIPDGEWVTTRSNGHQVNFAEWATAEETIPNVTGMSARDAMALLEKMGFKVSVRGSGKVRSQSLSPGHKFRKGVPITLFLS
ncbi:MAG: PASTA domain-containing protein [Bacteroidetes bacterium]|nr:MAG: PASTA domain-containing protein [Bacteroidota bacterium]